MGLSQRLKLRMRRFLQRPGTTVDLGPLEKHLPKIEAREDELSELTDEELTEAAGEAESYVDICAIGREAARRLGIGFQDGHEVGFRPAGGSRDLSQDLG